MEEQEHNEYVVRVMQVSCSASSQRNSSSDDSAAAAASDVRLIYQLHYAAWPDHGTPTAIEPIFDMLAYARQYQATESTPIVVHCR